MPSPPDGVPAYSWEGLAALAGFATGPMMRRERKQPRPGQKPAGTYWTGHAWHSLWLAADLVDMPPLSPGRQRQWDTNRTCARCSAVSADPWSKGRDMRRYCPECVRPAAEESWAAERAADRPVLTAWARELLGDDRTVLVAGSAKVRAVQVRAETPGGDVLADALIRHTDSDRVSGYGPRLSAEDEQRAVDVNAGVRLLAGLAGRRLVCWRPAYDLSDATLNLRQEEPDGPGLTPDAVGALRTAPDDTVGPRWDRWVGLPIGSVLYAAQCAAQSAPYAPQALVAHMRAALEQMAGTSDPQTPAAEDGRDDAMSPR